MVACRQRFFEFNTILLDITNLAEQLTVLILCKLADISHEDERRLFFILFGISCASLLNTLFISRRKQILLSIVIEVAEFGGYVSMFHLFDPNVVGKIIAFTMGIGTLSCLAFQLMLHVVNIIIVGRTDDESSPCQRIALLFYSAFIFIIQNGNQFVILFLRPNSQFHDTYFETLTTIGLSMASVINGVGEDVVRSSIRKFASAITSTDTNRIQELGALSELRDHLKGNFTKIYRYWFYGILASSFIMWPVSVITMVVYASQELRTSLLPLYDRVILIWTLVSSSLVIVLFSMIILLFFVALCHSCRSK